MAGRVRKRSRETSGGVVDAPSGGSTGGAMGVARGRGGSSGAKARKHPRVAHFERKRAAMEAEEVESDIESAEEGVAGAPGNGEPARGSDPSDSDDADAARRDDPAETADQKRLRLARAYLTKVGLDPDAPVDASGTDEDDAEGSDADERRARRGATGDFISRLQNAARKAAGKTLSEIARTVADKAENGLLPVARSLRAHDVAATCVALNYEGRRAVSGGKDSRVIAWDVETGAKVVSLRPDSYEPRYRKDPSAAPGHVGHVLSVCVADAHGGNIFASGGADAIVRVWDARAGKQVGAMRGHRGAVNAVRFRRGTMQLFSASTDRTVKIWDADDMAYVETLFGHGAEVCGLDSLMKERAVSCGRDGTMRLYKILDGSQLVFRRALTTSLDAVAMVNEQRFVSGGDDGSFALWHVTKKRPVAVVEHAHGEGTGCDTWISAVAAGSNTDLAASGAGDGLVRLWRCDDRPPALVPAARVDVGRGFVNGLAFDGDCKVLVAAIGQEPRLGRWDRKRQVKTGLRFVKLPGR